MKVSSTSISISPAHILLVDDHAAGLKVRKSILQELGYRVTVAAGADEALKGFAAETYDMVVTDYKMPKVNGVQLIERIRKTKPHIPIILLSGYVDFLGLSEATTGADLVIAKSANEVDHLVRGVARLLRRPLKKPPASVRRSGAKPKARNA